MRALSRTDGKPLTALPSPWGSDFLCSTHRMLRILVVGRHFLCKTFPP